MTTYYFNEEPDYRLLQNLVGGYFTCLQMDNGAIMFLNDNGAYKCKLNTEATEKYGFNIYGNIVIVQEAVE